MGNSKEATLTPFMVGSSPLNTYHHGRPVELLQKHQHSPGSSNSGMTIINAEGTCLVYVEKVACK